MSYNFIAIGNTRKAVGFDGAIRLEIDEEYVDDLLKAEAVFIETGFEILPYFPLSIKIDGHIVARFDDVQDREVATSLAGKPVYLREEEVSVQQPEDQLSSEYDLTVLVGTVVHDEKLGLIGTIEAIESYPQQEMMIINHNDKKVMIPLHPDLIVEMIPREIILMKLPEGLLDI